MAKIKVTFNNETKVITITKKYDTSLRVWYEFASMCLESMLNKVPDEYLHIPLIELPKEIFDNIFKVSEIEKQYDNYERKMISSLIRKIETNFKVKIKKSEFHFLNYDLQDEDKENDITHVFDCINVNEY
jgi:hypothetical protein